MPSDPLVLGLDTSAAHCAAALFRGDRMLAARFEEMTRGQAERLMPLIGELLAEAGRDWRDLDRIGVGIGPGNFTGIRIAVAAARGLALGLGIPAIGVTTFDATRNHHGDAPDIAVAVPAPRGQVYCQKGDAAPALVSDAAEARHAVPPDALAAAIARLAGMRRPGARPAPVYMRPADAAPSREQPPVLLP